MEAVHAGLQLGGDFFPLFFGAGRRDEIHFVFVFLDSCVPVEAAAFHLSGVFEQGGCFSFGLVLKNFEAFGLELLERKRGVVVKGAFVGLDLDVDVWGEAVCGGQEHHEGLPGRWARRRIQWRNRESCGGELKAVGGLATSGHAGRGQENEEDEEFLGHVRGCMVTGLGPRVQLVPKWSS